MFVVVILMIVILLCGTHNQMAGGGTDEASNTGNTGTAIRYGDVVHFQLGTKHSFLDTCGSTTACPGNGSLNVQTADTPTRNTGTGSWIIVKHETGGAMGTPIRHGDTVYIKNLHNDTYLDTCGHNSVCKALNVQTHKSPFRTDTGTGLWKLVDLDNMESTDIITNESGIFIESVHSSGDYVVACGHSSCTRGVYDISLLSLAPYGHSIHSWGKWIVRRQVKPGNEEEAISCCLGNNEEGCDGLGPKVCAHVISTLGTSTPGTAETIYNSGIYEKSPELQNKMDKDLMQKCNGEWAKEGLCDCFNVVEAASRIPGYNPICHNLRCASGLAYKTRNMKKVKCPGTNLTYCVQDLNLSNMDSAELSKIKLSNKCGSQAPPPSADVPDAPDAPDAPDVADIHNASNISWLHLLLAGAGVSACLGIIFILYRRFHL